MLLPGPSLLEATRVPPRLVTGARCRREEPFRRPPRPGAARAPIAHGRNPARRATREVSARRQRRRGARRYRWRSRWLGLLAWSVAMNKRAHERRGVDIPVVLLDQTGAERLALARDVSVGGMFVETEARLAIGSTLLVVVRLPGADHESRLPVRVRWARDGGLDLQFGLLGARDTHALTELARPPK